VSTSDTAALAGRTAAAIAAAARRMYPHEALPDGVYARVAQKLAEAASEDPETGRTIQEGVADLGEAFPELPAEEQLRALERIEGSSFFELVRSTAVVEVYSDPRTWGVLGYEGPSFDRGGYLRRGFDDLDWLPDPAAEEPS
jgi:hypothetical protein